MSDADIVPDAFNPRFLEDAQRRQAASSLINAAEDDPEKAARAVELGDVTGVPASLIHGDLDNFEAQHKLSVNQKLVNDNAFLKEYLTSHPMAASISHDDLGQLDTASQAMQTYGTDTGLARWLKEDSIAQSFLKGFGDQPIDTRRFYQGFVSQHDIDWALHTTRLQAATAGAASQVVGLGEIGMEGLSRVTAGLLHMGFDGMSAIFGESAARDLTAVAELAMMRGDIGVKSLGGDVPVKGREAGGTSGVMAQMEHNAKLFKDLHNALQIADHFPEGEPPPGVHPLIDTAKAEQAKTDGKVLKDALSESAKSATRDRSPDYYANFVRQHVGDREIGIDAEAVRALYGDKLPEVGDNILGWVPDLAGKLAAAEGIGGDIRVPLADYLARVDPDVAKELHDNLRLRDGGLTVEETRGLQSKEVIADPLQLVRGAGGLEPQFSLGDRKVTLERKPITEGGLEGPIAADNFRLLDENGKKIGFLDVTPYKDGTHLYIDNVGGFERLGFGPNGFGPAVTRDIARQLKAAYPNATHIGGFRVTGAREKAGTVREVWTKFSQETPDGWEHVEAGRTLRELFAEIGGQTVDTSHFE